MSLSGMVESPRQPDVTKKILQHLGLWEESHASPGTDPPVKEITFLPVRGRTQTGDPSYSYCNREASVQLCPSQAEVDMTLAYQVRSAANWQSRASPSSLALHRDLEPALTRSPRRLSA